MKRLFAPLLVGLFVIFCGRSIKEIPENKPLRIHLPHEAQPEEPELKAATPEDPGPIAILISPLAILTGRANSSTTQTDRYIPLEPLPIDHHIDLPSEKPRKLLNKVFPINKYVQFAFVVPPHQSNTRLRGAFRSFTKRRDPDSTSGSTAGLDLMVLDDQQFQAFLHGQPQTAAYELDSVHEQEVDWRVPTTYADPQTYHLVFSNPGSATKIKFVEADFTVSFE